MKKVLSLLLTAALLNAVGGFTIALAQTHTQNQVQLSNKDVVEMIKAGLSADIVVAKIKSSPSKFETTPAALTELKSAGIPDVVILAMVQSAEKPVEVGTASETAGSNDGVVKVVDGTEVEIQLTNTLSGQTAKVGDIVDFTIVRPVQINGVTIFEKDASARARVTTAKGAGRWGKAGKLEWAMQDLQAVDGNRVPARFTRRETGDSKGGTVAVAAVVTTVLLGPLGLLWGLKKGKPAIIPAGNRYSVFVHGDTAIKAKVPGKQPS